MFCFVCFFINMLACVVCGLYIEQQLYKEVTGGHFKMEMLH